MVHEISFQKVSVKNSRACGKENGGTSKRFSSIRTRTRTRTRTICIDRQRAFLPTRVRPRGHRVRHSRDSVREHRHLPTVQRGRFGGKCGVCLMHMQRVSQRPIRSIVRHDSPLRTPISYLVHLHLVVSSIHLSSMQKQHSFHIATWGSSPGRRSMHSRAGSTHDQSFHGERRVSPPHAP